MDSPQSLRCQSVKVPVCLLTMVSLTMMVQVPTPDSPLGKVSWCLGEDGERGGYAPMRDAHEGPVDITGGDGIGRSGDGQMAHNLARTDQVDADVATTGVGHVHGDGYVLKALEVGRFEGIGGDLEADGDAHVPLGDVLVDVDPWRKVPRLGLDVLPRLGGFDDRPRINLSVAIGVAEPLADGGGLPVAVVEVDRHRGAHGQVLHISPRDIGPDLQDEGKDAGRQGGSSRRPAMDIRARVCADIRGVDGVAASARVRDDKVGGALFRIVPMEALPINGRHRDAVYAVGVAVKVAVVL